MSREVTIFLNLRFSNVYSPSTAGVDHHLEGQGSLPRYSHSSASLLAISARLTSCIPPSRGCSGHPKRQQKPLSPLRKRQLKLKKPAAALSRLQIFRTPKRAVSILSGALYTSHVTQPTRRSRCIR